MGLTPATLSVTADAGKRHVAGGRHVVGPGRRRAGGRYRPGALSLSVPLVSLTMLMLVV